MIKSLKNDALLYNVKILRSFVSYLKTYYSWSDLQVKSLFEKCGSDISFLESDDNWFNQEFADRFHDWIVSLTNDKNIAFKVGSFSCNESSSGLAGTLARSFLSPEIVFNKIGDVTSHFTKGSIIYPVKIQEQHAHLRAEINYQCKEKPYQCQNRMGMLAAVPKMFSCANVKISHPKCYHTGGEACEYVITWDKPWMSYSLPFLLLIFGSVLLTLKYAFSVGPVLGYFLFGSILIFFIDKYLKSRHLSKTLSNQNKGLELSLQILDARHEQATLLRTIINTTTAMMPIPELCVTSAELIQTKMKYDRVLIMLVNTEKNILETKAIVGYESEAKAMIEKAEFNIRPDNMAGHFIKAVNTKKSLLVRNVQKNMDQLSPRSQKLLKTLGTDSFATVPIVFLNKVLGIIAVENGKDSRPLSYNDLQLLEPLADHLAVAISNSRSFEATQASLETTRKLERQERYLRQLFQCYVPTEMLIQDKIKFEELFRLEQKVLNIMFIDIVGFTSLSEHLLPEDTAEILNTFIERIQDQISMDGGKINKIMGDGLLIYSDPTNHNIILAGYHILECVPIINETLKEKNLPSISIGIGVHRGRCTLGNIGSADRLDYTIIGEAVNTASRIEGYTRTIGPNTFCFSSAVLDDTAGFSFQSQGKIRLKGLQEPIEIFQFLSKKTHKGTALLCTSEPDKRAA